MLTIKLLTEAHSRPAMIQRLAPGLGSGDEVKSDKSTTVVDYQRDGEAEPRSITVSIPAPFVQALGAFVERRDAEKHMRRIAKDSLLGELHETRSESRRA